MKRHEKMTKEEIIAFTLNKQCSKCEAYEYCSSTHGNCEENMQKWLNVEIKTKPRWATIKSNDDVDKLLDEFLHTTYEVEFTEWLKEEVEV